MKEAVAVLGTMVGVIIAFTILGGGNINLGTSSTGPYLNFGYKGPQNKG
jgi:hypothetical protein